ncbi:hypothetical protein [Anaeromyxobacter dehalogenans]|uniref:Glycosyltransferase RgtA/B/C/D-like domain-containing protein n=1 Tax=Anaeromyxobacter dehalogenans (strain 2CP-C) TaxID=290397 RepID=Q2IIT1_ANADE|nr:hypothetical protein [Anaeromyxobacter dehalogenans]ABC81558.1 hypothetical protein Adeh_1785 [Anaeromyxobacter dehalogenans 2CP-C]
MLAISNADDGEVRPAGRFRAAWTVLALAACVALPAWIQFGFMHVAEDADTDYHVAVGRLIHDHGILKAFPWTPFSVLAEHYADKELLFHLMLAPLAGLDPATAANVAGTIAGALALAAILLVLRQERVPLAGAWIVVPLLASSAFVYRFSLVRPHLLSIGLALVVLWAAARERRWILALASAIYPWAYVAWQLPLALALLAEAARFAAERRASWRGPAIALGVATHPNGWNLVRFSAIVIDDVLLRRAWGRAAGIELGGEFQPFTWAEWRLLLVPTAAMALAALGLAWRRRREGGLVALAFAGAALAFGALTLRTARFTEYFVPFSAVAFALSVRHLRPRLALAATLVLCAAYSGRETARILQGMSTRPPRTAPAEAAAMQRAIPPGAQVFTCEWGLTGTLMLALPERRFMVALDPTLFALQDPERYALWYRLPRAAPPGLARTIREQFGARYVACWWDDRFRPFFDRIAFEPGVRPITVAGQWNVYELREP